MNNTSISPGLWSVIGNSRQWPMVVDGQGRALAKTDCSLNSSGNWVDNFGEAQANARAISALPLFIAACQKMDNCNGYSAWALSQLSHPEREAIEAARYALSVSSEPLAVDKPAVLYAVSKDGGNTGVAWRTDVLEALDYCDLQNKGGYTDYCVVAVRTGVRP